MASVVTYSGGLKRIEFTMAPNTPRKMIRLGRVNARTAETWKSKVEIIVGDMLSNRPHDPETSAWLGGLDESWLSRLRAVGLADGVGLAQTTLVEFLDRFFATLTSKPGTRVFYQHTRDNLEEFFGKVKIVRGITSADADAWQAWLVEHEKLSPATVSRRTVAARTIWRKAVRWNFTDRNPFEGIRAGHQSNESRKFFVSRKAIDRILENCTSTEWKGIIALSRFGGLRCPSEHFALRWGDIDWDRGTIRVPCPKLEHREGHAYRTVPLFPELREHLLKLFSESEDGDEYVLTKCRGGAMNLRTQFERIIKRAGETPWPRLFHNLRASRESELMREYDLATVCKWIGNSPSVAATHYATSVDLNSDFRRAAGFAPSAVEAQQNAQQSAHGEACQQKTSRPITNKKTLHKQGSVDAGHAVAIGGKTHQWARQDSNL